MKKLSFIFSILVLVSCVSELKPENPGESIDPVVVLEGEHPVFRAQLEKPEKASLNGLNVVWNAGDEIAISDSEGHNAIYRTVSGGSETDFKYASGDVLSTSGSATYTAWYPASLKSGYLNMASSIPMKAVSSSTNLQFKNLTGLVKLSLRGTFSNLREIVLSADRAISGSFDSSVNPGSPLEIQSGANSVQLSVSAENGDLNTTKVYYIAIPAASYSSLQFGLLFADGSLAFFKGGAVTIGRSQISPGETVVSHAGNGDVVDLSSSGTANCYLATQKADFSFSAEDANAASAEIIWQDAAEIISPVVLHDGKIWFRKNLSSSTYTAGNALVGVRDAKGVLLKTWHIWAPGEMAADGSAMAVSTNAGVMMDRNLGATSSTPGNAGAAGLFYQWGRSRPLRNSADGWTSTAVTNTATWLPGAGAKGAEDPCPRGWHIPDGGGHGALSTTHGVGTYTITGTWANAFGTGFAFYGRAASGKFWNGTKRGMDIPSTFMGGMSWFPATGELDSQTGTATGTGSTGSLWTRTSDDSTYGSVTSFCMTFGEAGRINPSARSLRTAGRNIRCVKE